MKSVNVAKIAYRNSFGSIDLLNVDVFLEENDLAKFVGGVAIEDLDYGLPGAAIRAAEKSLAIRFFTEKYRQVISGEYTVATDEIKAIQTFLNLNNKEFSRLLFITEGALTNIYKRKKSQNNVGGIALERLAMELVRPGSAKQLLSHRGGTSDIDAELQKTVDYVRFG